MDWSDIKWTYRSFRWDPYFRRYGKTLAVQQTFHRMVHWLYELMPEEEARNFMVGVVDPDPIIDWETGLEPGDPCPKHPNQKLGRFNVPIKENPGIHLECIECEP